MESKVIVKTIQVDYECPFCYDGKLRPTSKVLLSHPPKYPHKCTKCDFKKTFNKTYPYIVYE